MAEVVRLIYLERQDALIGLSRRGQSQGLFFRGGEIHLDSGHPQAASFARLLPAKPTATPPELQRLVEALAFEMADSCYGWAHLDAESELFPVSLVGPLPTVLLAMEIAAQDCDEREILAALGGESARLRLDDETPAMRQLPTLDPDMAQLFTDLAEPMGIRNLLGTGNPKRLMALVKLWAVGLVREVGAKGTLERIETTGEMLSLRLLENFLNRISEDLAAEPLELPLPEHRRQIVELLKQEEALSHYEVLGLEPQATEEELHAAYRALARKAHPSHATRLRLEGREDGLVVLFEHAARAYLTLSDPQRRIAYNQAKGIQAMRQDPQDPEQREKEKIDLARRQYKVALHCMSDAVMEYSTAVDLLTESIRLDPRAEYFALLARAQSKNPHWHDDAIKSYRRALEGNADDAETRAAFAMLLEKKGEVDEARLQYEEALKTMPEHPEAAEGLRRLGGPKGRGLRGLLGV